MSMLVETGMERCLRVCLAAGEELPRWQGWHCFLVLDNGRERVAYYRPE